MNTLQTLIEMIRETNPDRHQSNLNRRVIKVFEELGEVAEAFLNCTGFNGKNKTWDDLREEVVDVLILTTDISLTPFHESTFGNGDRKILTNVAPIQNLFDYKDFEDSFIKISKYASNAYYSRNSHVSFWSNSFSAFDEALKLAYTPLPDQENFTLDQIEEGLLKEMRRKLDKWKAKMARMIEPTDDV